MSLASAPAPVLAPAGREEGATGVVAPSPAATGIANTAANAAAGPSAPAPRSAPRFLPEPLANQQKLAGAAPDFPAHLAVNGALYVIHARICVATSGDVERIELLKTAHPTLDANVRSAVGRWRYRPLLAGAVPIPFCTLARFEFRAT
ncbi:MAG TPA: energy transducer TonB [Polyangia bacterium]